MKLLTISELAELLRVKVGQIYMMNHAGTGPKPIRLGRRTVRYSETDVLAWIESRRNGEVE